MGAQLIAGLLEGIEDPLLQIKERVLWMVMRDSSCWKREGTQRRASRNRPARAPRWSQ